MKDLNSQNLSLLYLIKVNCLAFLMVAGCTTLITGTEQKIHVNSFPNGAVVTTDHSYFCAPTPCFIEVPKRTSFALTVSMVGYDDAVFKIKSGGDGDAVGASMLGNIGVAASAAATSVMGAAIPVIALIPLIGGPTADLHSGANLTLSPPTISVRLSKHKPPTLKTD